MIKNTHKAIMEYSEAMAQGKHVLNKEISHAKANFVEGSDTYKLAVKTAQDAFKTSFQPVADRCRNAVKTDFEGVKANVRKVLTTAPSNDLPLLIQLVRSGNLNDTEIQIILEERKGNYFDSKMLHEAAGKPFTNVEIVLDGINRLEKQVERFFEYCGKERDSGEEYTVKLIENGSWIESVDALTDEFISTYGKGDEE